MSHLGRDFSSYQGDLSDADVAGIDFAYVKATEGATYKNPYAVQQNAKLRAAGVKVGYYHFLTQGDHIGDQLDYFHKMASSLGTTDLPVALDVEIASPQGWQSLAADMMQFAMNVEGWNNWVPNPRSMFYVNLNFYDNLAALKPPFPWGRWVWLADPNAGAPHRPCLVLQQAPRPVSATDLKVIDPDVFVGSDADWAQFTRQTGGVLPPAPIGPEAPLQAPLDITLPAALDANGHGWYAYAALGLPANANVVNVTPLGADPASTGGYSPDDVVRAFEFIDVPGHQEIVVYGVPNGRYSVRIEWSLT